MCNNIECFKCEIREWCEEDGRVSELPDNIDDIVCRWVKTHSLKTYKDDFFERLPNAPKMGDGTLPEEIYLISGEDNRGQTVRFGFCYSKEEAREAIVRYAKKGFFWCKYEVINVLGDETNGCE